MRDAVLMIEGGALEGVDAIVGGHVDRRLAVGQVIAEAGPMNAAAEVSAKLGTLGDERCRRRSCAG